MKATIYSPVRNPMQSGQAKSGEWQLVFTPEAAPTVDPVMGWTGMNDTTQQLKLGFADRAAAIRYATENNIIFEVIEPKERVIKPKAYAENFLFRTEVRA